MSDSDPVALYTYVIQKLNERHIGFIEVTEGFSFNPEIHNKLKDEFFKERTEKSVREIFKPLFTNGLYISNQGFSPDSAEEAIKNGEADLISFGELFIANEKPSENLKTGMPLLSSKDVADPSKIPSYMYSHSPVGYSDISVYQLPESK